jgi:hypothetical protein
MGSGLCRRKDGGASRVDGLYRKIIFNYPKQVKPNFFDFAVHSAAFIKSI